MYHVLCFGVNPSVPVPAGSFRSFMDAVRAVKALRARHPYLSYAISDPSGSVMRGRVATDIR